MDEIQRTERDSKTHNRKYDLSARLFGFSVLVIKIVSTLPRTLAGRQIGAQLFNAGTSAGANYEEALGAESKNDFIHKLGIVLKELREAHYWCRLIQATGMLAGDLITGAIQEADELRRIIASSISTAKSNIARPEHLP